MHCSIYISTWQVVLKSIFQECLTDSRGGKNRIFCGRPEWEACLQLLLSRWSEPAWLQLHALLAVFCYECLCWAVLTPCLGFCSIISPKFSLLSCPRQRKSKVRTQRQVLQAASQACSQAPESQTWQLRGCDVWNTAHKGACSICMHPT